MSNTQIIVCGSLAFDQIMLYPGAFADQIMPDKHHIISTSFLVSHLEKNQGGTAGNISYNLGLLDKPVICAAYLGKDGKDYKEYLKAHKVNTDFVKISDKDYSASFVVFTDKKDCQISAFYQGAMKEDTNISLAEILKFQNLKIEDIFLVIAPTYQKAMLKLIREAKNLNIRYLFSGAQQIQYFSSEELLEAILGAEIIIGNDYEIALLQEKIQMSKSQLLDKVKILVTTLGERGSLVEQREKQEIVIGKAKVREVKDPTGVGDAYIAGFLSGYLDNKSLIECGQMGTVAASFVLEEYGTTKHSYSLSIFNNRLKENFC